MEAEQTGQPRYVGFWMRVLASVIDTVIIGVVLGLILAAVFAGSDAADPETLAKGGALNLTLNVLIAIAIILFWRYRGATPGKMAISARVVDVNTGGAPSTGKLIGRYLAYFVSTIPFGLGFLWVAFDRRKQGWHDKLAGTAVVYEK